MYDVIEFNYKNETKMIYYGYRKVPAFTEQIIEICSHKNNFIYKNGIYSIKHFRHNHINNVPHLVGQNICLYLK